MKPVTSRLLQLLLGSELVGVAALSLAAVGRTRGKTGLCGESTVSASNEAAGL